MEARVTPVPFRRRLWIAILFGITGGILAIMRSVELMARLGHRDFAQTWFAARAVLTGGDPYQLIRPGGAFEWPGWFYPLPAAFVAVPFAPFPEHIAVGLFVAVGCAALAWALMEHGAPPMLAMFSTCVANAVYCAQWSPLYAGAFALAPLGIALVAKPTIGAAVFVARPSWWALCGGVALTLLAFVVHPRWVMEWRETLALTSVGPGARWPYFAPVSLPGGLIPLLALAKWRRPEARLLVALALVPQTLIGYEGVLLFLIPRGWIESAALLGASYVLVYRWIVPYDSVDLATWIAIYGAGMVMFLYVPATLMVLLRPNEGAVPAWLDRALVYLPPALRGNGGSAPAPTLSRADTSSSGI